MVRIFINYLIESSLCMLIFMAVYRLLIAQLTHFFWMRFYLLCSLAFSVVLPLVILPVQWQTAFVPSIHFGWNIFPGSLMPQAPDTIAISPLSDSSGLQINLWHVVFIVASAFYIAGATYKAINLFRKLKKIRDLISSNASTKEGSYRIISFRAEVPAFSFFNYIFINQDYRGLGSRDLQTVKDHEILHAKQLHTADILLAELASVIFWFNPMMNYFTRSLRDVHEYIIDEKIAGLGETKRSYAKLLLNLATGSKVFDLAVGFTDRHIKRRIEMISRTRTSPFYKLVFALLIPLTSGMLLSFSWIRSPDTMEQHSPQHKSGIIQHKIAGKITWTGNHLFTADTLNKLLGIKTGDLFSFDDLNYRLTGGNISTLYMDNGYVFYKADFSTDLKPDNVYDLDIKIYEGVQALIGKIYIKGNKTVPTADILKRISFKSGDLFSKTKIIKSVEAIAAMGHFDPDRIIPTPLPDLEKSQDEFATVDLVFEVTEIKQ